MSLAQLAEHLNESRELTRGGATFTATTVKRILDRARIDEV